MPLTYPPAAPTLTGDQVLISRFLESPTLLGRALRTILQNRFIADTLLTGRYSVSGGALQYETGESIYVGDNPRSVAPGAEYPLTSVPTGVASLAQTKKWGEDTLVTDEAIKRLLMDPVRRALVKLANQNVKYIDSIALSVIASSLTTAGNTQAAAASWVTATAQQMLFDALSAKATILGRNQGYDPDTVAVSDLAWARAMSGFIAAGYVPREGNDNPALTGNFPTIAGMRWLPTPNLPVAATALVVDSSQLGGMADEDLGGPGYVNIGAPGIEAKTMRDDENDQYRLRCRRVTVPVVIEPGAGQLITGVGV